MRRRPTAPDRLLATVLFTDIVGSTELAAEMGDRSWKGLVARHHALVRKELKRFGGRELDTAGDGFFAIFERPARAIECASAIMDALRPLGIRIRAGIHMGECEVMGGKVGGITVHVGARVLGRAEPGQILVTGTVREVAAGSGIGFDDRGTHELKGVPGQWRLFAVEREADDDLSPTDRQVLEALQAPVPRARRGWARVVAAGAIGALVAVGALVLFLLTRGDPSVSPSAPRPNSAVSFDVATNEVVDVVGVGDSPTGVVIADGSAWVLSVRNRTITVIDLETGATTSFGLAGPPTGIAAGPGAVWVTQGFGTADTAEAEVLRISTATRQIEQKIGVPNGTQRIAIGEEGAWVTNGVENTVTRIDLESGQVFDPVAVGEQPDGIAVGAGGVWVANALSRTVWRLDPRSGEQTGEVTLSDQPAAIAIGLGRVWVTSAIGNSLAVVDAETLRLVTTISVGQGPTGVAVGEDAVWVSLGEGALVRVDPESLEVEQSLRLPGPAGGVAVGSDAVWVTVQG